MKDEKDKDKVGVGDNSECMGKTFQAATTNTWELFDPTSLLQNIFFDICQTELPPTSGV